MSSCTGMPTTFPCGVNPGTIISTYDTTSTIADESKNPQITRSPWSDRRNCASSSGMTSRRWNHARPSKRWVQSTPAHIMPINPRHHNATGRPPRALATSRLTDSRSSPGNTTTNQAAVQIPVAVIDHGKLMATRTTSQSASRNKKARSRRTLGENASIYSITFLDRTTPAEPNSRRWRLSGVNQTKQPNGNGQHDYQQHHRKNK